MATYDDPRILRAVAHPTRNRILSELFAAGPMRAADLARTLDVPANQASFHLRQLAKYGLVEEAPDEARDRRDRVWRLADADGISFRTGEVLKQPGGRAAYAVFQRSAVAWGHHLVDVALRPDEDKRHRSVSEWSLRLTPEESSELLTEMSEVVERWRARTQSAVEGAAGEGAAGEGEERRTYSVYQLIQPLPAPEAAREPGTETTPETGTEED